MKVFIIAGVGDHTKYIERRTRNWKARYDLEPIVLKFGWKGNYSDNYTSLTSTRSYSPHKIPLFC